MRVSEQGGGVVGLDGVLDFTTAMDTLEQIQTHLSTSTVQTTVSLAGLSRANSAALAVMLEVRLEAERVGKSVNFADVPTELVQLARISEVDAVLGLEEA